MCVKMFLYWENLILILLLVPTRASLNPGDKDDSTSGFYHPKRKTASNCNIYLAPSEIGGWGVFAARDFSKNEMVEVVPRYLPRKFELMNANVLDDYIYSFLWKADPEDATFGVAIFGMAMFYNHGAGALHNVQFTDFGHEPGKEPNEALMVLGLGFRALKKIRRGEELLSSYGETEEWFSARGIDMSVPLTEPPKLPNIDEIEALEKQYCSKLYAGWGHSTWKHRVIPTHSELKLWPPYLKYVNDLPLQDHATAVAKENAKAGQILEMASALLVPLEQVEDSPFAPFAITWDDWDDDQKESVLQLRDMGALSMKKLNETGWMTFDPLDKLDHAVVIPFAGNIGLVRKVGRHDTAESNCRIEIISSADDQGKVNAGNAGIVLRLVATKDIDIGEEVRLNMPESSSWKSKVSALQHLAMTGQPIPKFLADPYNDDMSRVRHPSYGDSEL